MGPFEREPDCTPLIFFDWFKSDKERLFFFSVIGYDNSRRKIVIWRS